MIERDGLAVRLLHACMEVITSEDELAQVDVAGGHIMVEVVSAISSSIAASTGDILDLFDDAARAVSRLDVSGGTVEFWDAWLEGLAEGAPGDDEMDLGQFRAMLALGRDEYNGVIEDFIVARDGTRGRRGARRRRSGVPRGGRERGRSGGL